MINNTWGTEAMDIMNMTRSYVVEMTTAAKTPSGTVKRRRQPALSACSLCQKDAREKTTVIGAPHVVGFNLDCTGSDL